MGTKTVTYYSEKINAYDSQFSSAIDDFKKYYILYNKNSESDEYKNSFDTVVKQIQDIVKGLNDVTDDLQYDIELIDNSINNYNTKMGTERQLNKEFSNISTSIINTSNGSNIRKKDYVGLYNKQYNLNWEIGVGIFLAIVILLKVFQGQKSQDYSAVVWIILLLLIVLVYWVLLKVTTYFFPFKPLNL